MAKHILKTAKEVQEFTGALLKVELVRLLSKGKTESVEVISTLMQLVAGLGLVEDHPEAPMSPMDTSRITNDSLYVLSNSPESPEAWRVLLVEDAYIAVLASSKLKLHCKDVYVVGQHYTTKIS